MQCVEGGDREHQVLLGGQPADHGDDQRGGVRAPLPTQCRGAAPRIEKLGVDTARHHLQILKVGAGETACDLLRRYQRDLTAVVEAAQVALDAATQPADAVVAAVGVEIGMEARTDRQVEPPRRGQRRPAQRPFGGDMDDIRSLFAPGFAQGAVGRQADAQARVAR